MAKPKAARPKKPTRNFPLFPHTDGTWKPTRPIAGKRPSFGSWVNDRDGALAFARYQQWLSAGAPPAATSRADVPDACTVSDLFNKFLVMKAGQVDAGELEARTYQDYRADLAEFAKLVGPDRPAASLTPADFRAARRAWEARFGPHALNRHVQNVRAAFRAAGPEEMRLLSRPPHYGGEFRRVALRARRRARREAEQAHGKRLFTPAEVRRILAAAEQPLKTCVLLGLNCGFLAIDCARLVRSAVDLSGAFIEFHRQKTENYRAATLWPETVEALRDAIERPRAYRRPPREGVPADLVFLTRNRWPLVRETVARAADGSIESVAHNDALSQAFYELLRDLGIKGDDDDGRRKGLNFSALRKTHRTYADEAGDANAARVLMGHAVGEGVEEFYVRDVARRRLKHVTDHVRSVLLLKCPKGSARRPPDAAAGAPAAAAPARGGRRRATPA